jgi:hypothetical protein
MQRPRVGTEHQQSSITRGRHVRLPGKNDGPAARSRRSVPLLRLERVRSAYRCPRAGAVRRNSNCRLESARSTLSRPNHALNNAHMANPMKMTMYTASIATALAMGGCASEESALGNDSDSESSERDGVAETPAAAEPEKLGEHVGTSVEALRWGAFKKDGCSGDGLRQYSAVLWDIPWGHSWERTCANASAWVQDDVGGWHFFPRPTRCVNHSGINMWGEFDVEDASCRCVDYEGGRYCPT